MWLQWLEHFLRLMLFLLTHPVWDVTFINLVSIPFTEISTHTSRVGCDCIIFDIVYLCDISTHTSRVGCDGWLFIIYAICFHFYSHIPCGMWLLRQYEMAQWSNISTHTSRVGCDLSYQNFVAAKDNFYSHIPCGMWHWRESTDR